MALIYKITCECGKILEITRSEIDHDHDVTLTVSKCEDCIEEAKNEGIDLGKGQSQ